MRRKVLAGLLAALLFAAVFSACSNEDEAPAGDGARLKEIGEAMVEDIDKYVLPNKETPEKLVENGFVVFMDEKTYGEALLEDFSFAYERGEDCTLTIVLVDNNFRAVRAACEDGEGYYCRFEQDPSKPDSIPVSGEFFDNLTLERMLEGIPRWELGITYKGKDVARIGLRYPSELKTAPEDTE
jgi:hypothetical protein